MNSDQLAVERAAWTVALRQKFTHSGYICHEHVNDYQTFLVVNHEDSPGWKVVITICSAHNKRNRIEINGAEVVRNCDTHQRMVLLRVLDNMRRSFDALNERSKESEAKAAEWIERQQKELSGLVELKGVDIEIITRGFYEGQYRVILQPGNPLEHLTLDQLRMLHQFLKALWEITK